MAYIMAEPVIELLQLGCIHYKLGSVAQRMEQPHH